MSKRKRTELSFEDYLRQVADESQPLSIAGLYRLSNLSEDDLSLLEMAWASVPARRRREITRHLVDITEVNFEMECEPFFLLCLDDSDAEVREAAIDGLWIYENTNQVAPLLKMMLTDPAVNVRAAAAASLARFVLMAELDQIPPSRHAIIHDVMQSLRAVIADQDEDVQVRRRAIEAIAYSGDQDIPNLLRQAYASADEKMRISAMCGMGRSADDVWKAIVIKELESANPEMRYEAARAAGELELQQAVPGLAALLDDPDREVQEMAIWALGQIGGRRASQLLHKCYEEGDEETRQLVGDTLEEMALMRGEDLPLFVFDPSEEEELDWDDFQDLEDDLDIDE